MSKAVFFSIMLPLVTYFSLITAVFFEVIPWFFAILLTFFLGMFRFRQKDAKWKRFYNASSTVSMVVSFLVLLFFERLYL